MNKFNKGDKVINVNSNEKGIIIDVYEAIRGRQLYSVKYGLEEKDSLESNLISDTNLTDPYECCKKGLFGSYLDFFRINTSHKIQNTSNNTISSLKASKTLFKAYQFKPLLKFLNSENRRILIADEVGLGKTIEAGHIMMELSARKEFKNALIICPKMLQEKWKNELKEKFNFNFKIYEKPKDIINDIETGFIKGIVNYERIRSNENKHDESNLLLKYISEHNVKFDLVLCDEAHRLRNSGTKTYKGAQKLIPFSNSAVFLTATPIMISEVNLYNLLHLLDGQQFDNKEIFQSYLSINKPFISAISKLNNNVSLPEIAEFLQKSEIFIRYGENGSYENHTTVNELFKDIPLYNKIIHDLTIQNDSIDKRVQLQFDISSMSMMNNIFSRTRKREVTTDWTQAVRNPQKKYVSLFEDEKLKYENVINKYITDNGYVDEYGDAQMSQGHNLGLIQKKRRIASSIYGYLNSNEDLDNGVDAYEMYQDSKFNKLLEILNEVVVNNNKKIIVFALFKNTLKYLDIRLKKHGFNQVTIHGDIKERDSVIKNFKVNNSINILLSSEVGSEGLDMQFCDALVNYDLPWNPMVVEQRIGRIDRFGQKSQIVNIYNLIVKGSIQEDIYIRLLDRIGIFSSCIGDLEAILDKDTVEGTIQQRLIKLEKELYCTELNEKERELKIENISKAILIEKQNLEDINEGLTDTLTNDIYFKNEIDSIQNNYRYITAHELFNFVQSLIKNELTECVISEEEEFVYLLKLPFHNKSYLKNFLHNNQPVNPDKEVEILFSQFINSIRDSNSLKITFNQSIAYERSDLIFVTAYHPLIIAAKICFERKQNDVKIAFQFGLKNSDLTISKKIPCGEYFLVTYSLYIVKRLFNREQVNEILVPVIYDINNNKIISDSDICEKFLGECQLFATANQFPLSIDAELINLIRTDFAFEIDSIYQNYINDQTMRMQTTKLMQLQRTEEFYDNKISILNQTLIELELKSQDSNDINEKNKILKVLPAQRGLLNSLLLEKEDALNKIEGNMIHAKEPKLLTLSQIKIY